MSGVLDDVLFCTFIILFPWQRNYGDPSQSTKELSELLLSVIVLVLLSKKYKGPQAHAAITSK